ncbi:MAG: MBL fold metallo-hydrolase [Christensenella sp.]|uniref:MBL fold metallo-hydrolase n=1 Tax=Christensenella sp. TaxID=1935934 RepID=UPI002B200E2C|nr:MBL fold metallo-hydrolase [Christensenella sp.]MEA5004557.1 MBL fold metallo-hydrolase [Christensenella sp.]
MTKIIPLRFGGDNCYIIENGENAVLVDTGRPAIREKLLCALAPWKVRYVLLTHGHFDHVGNAVCIAKKYGAKIAIAQEDESLAQDNRTRAFGSRGLIGAFIRMASMAAIKKTQFETFTPDFYLQDGQKLDELGIDARVIALHGHTAGSVGIVAGGGCIAGDTIMNMGGVSRARIAEDFAGVDECLDKLRKTGAEWYYPGHGKPVSKKQMDRL